MRASFLPSSTHEYVRRARSRYETHFVAGSIAGTGHFLNLLRDPSTQAQPQALDIRVTP